MRHTDMRLTMNVYTDPKIFDMAGAVEETSGDEGVRGAGFRCSKFPSHVAWAQQKRQHCTGWDRVLFGSERQSEEARRPITNSFIWRRLATKNPIRQGWGK
jgi:hypothetical protein